MGKKVRRKVKFTKLIIWIAIGIIGAIVIYQYMNNPGIAVLVASLCFAIGLASLVPKKKR